MDFNVLSATPGHLTTTRVGAGRLWGGGGGEGVRGLYKCTPC